MNNWLDINRYYPDQRKVWGAYFLLSLAIVLEGVPLYGVMNRNAALQKEVDLLKSDNELQWSDHDGLFDRFNELEQHVYKIHPKERATGWTPPTGQNSGRQSGQGAETPSPAIGAPPAGLLPRTTEEKSVLKGGPKSP
jgi:hypothetical protein